MDEREREYLVHQIQDLANTVSGQAEAIANGFHTDHLHAAVRLLQDNVVTMAAWSARIGY